MLENIIKFETAELAKIKGFVKNGSYYYDIETGESYLRTAHNRIDLITNRYIKAPNQYSYKPLQGTDAFAVMAAQSAIIILLNVIFLCLK